MQTCSGAAMPSHMGYAVSACKVNSVCAIYGCLLVVHTVISASFTFKCTLLQTQDHDQCCYPTTVYLVYCSVGVRLES